MLLKYAFVLAVGIFVGLNMRPEVPTQPYPGTMGVEKLEEPKPEEPKVEEPKFVVLDRISAYNPVPRQTQGDHNVSSCGANRPNQIAVSRDLFFDSNGRKHLCGKTVTVYTDRGEVFDQYVVWDTMSPRYTKTVDILFPTTDESVAYDFGVTTGKLVFHN